MSKPIVVLGASGYTGRLTADALERLGATYVVAGRDRAKLEALSSELPSRPAVRIANVDDPSSLRVALADASVVVTTVGPFRVAGLAVVEAALAAGVHYVDSTAEQPFQQRVVERYHAAAVQRGVTMLTGHACDFTFGYAGAAILDAQLGPLTEVHTYHVVNDFEASQGTAKSMVGLLGDAYLAFRDGRFIRQAAQWTPRAVDLPGERAPAFAVPFPGGDVVLLPRDYPSLRACSSNLVLPRRDARGFAVATSLQPLLRPLATPRLLARLERMIAARLVSPTPAQRSASRWAFVVHGVGPGGEGHCRMEGPDTYGISGDTMALAATWLARGDAKSAGVVSTGRAFDARAFLDALAPRGVAWSIACAPRAPSQAQGTQEPPRVKHVYGQAAQPL